MQPPQDSSSVLTSKHYKSAQKRARQLQSVPRRSRQLLESGRQLSLLDRNSVLDASDWTAAFFDPTEMLGLLPSERKPEKDISIVANE